MKLVIVAVKDRAVDGYMRPFTVPHRNAALRSFTDEANRKESEINAHPEDYDLYEIATFDDQTGNIENIKQPPELIARAQDLIRKE